MINLFFIIHDTQIITGLHISFITYVCSNNDTRDNKI